MIQLIVGHKGSGKTKAIVEMANKAVKESKGYVVVIEKDVRLTYEISSAARLFMASSPGCWPATMISPTFTSTPSLRCADAILRPLPRW